MSLMTKEGHSLILAEIKELQLERREALSLVADSASVGDRSHDVDYHQSRARLASIDLRLHALSERLAGARIVDTTDLRDNSRVFFGATVSFRNIKGHVRKVTLVGPEDSDPTTGRINSASPIGQALMGRAVGDTVEIHAPSGSIEAEILSIS